MAPRRRAERILTTHTGSLPRSARMRELLSTGDRGTEYARVAREAVAATVARQLEIGLDIVNDGEVAKPGFATYVTERLDGFSSRPRPREAPVEVDHFPGFWANRPWAGAREVMTCVGELSWQGDAEIGRDVENLRAALADQSPAGAFMSAASPGTVWYYQPDEHYADHAAYLMALADAMKPEYDAIHAAGFLLQLDCPDLAGGWNRPVAREMSPAQFRDLAALHVEALNRATRDIPPEALRMHVCWGNYEGPHTRDIPLGEILDVLLSARPAALSFEGANPRHEHEWEVFTRRELPAGKVLMPGVIDSTTNYVEHPQLVAQRILRYAEAVGAENVIACADCGFETLAGMDGVDPEVAWAKLASLVEGARLASDRLWS